MIDLEEVCLTCKHKRGEHRRERLSWKHMEGVMAVSRQVEFWQDDICPWLHNMTQPPWDIYLFRGNDWYAVSNQPEWSKRNA